MYRQSELNELHSNELTCPLLDELKRPAVLIWSEQRDLPSDDLASCADRLAPQTYYSPQGFPVFRAASIGAGGAVKAAVSPEPASPTAPQSLVVSPATLDGAPVTVSHSQLDIGQVSDIFDGKPESLMRGARDNPLVVEIRFQELRRLEALDLTVGTMNHFTIALVITYADDTTAEVSGDYTNLPPDPTVTLQLPASDEPVKILHIEIVDIRPMPGGGYHIHVRDISVH